MWYSQFARTISAIIQCTVQYNTKYNSVGESSFLVFFLAIRPCVSK